MGNLTQSELAGVIGHTAVGPSGMKVGKIEQVYVDAERGSPTWFVVTIGAFSKRPKFVPMTGARLEGTKVHLGYDQSHVKHAPDVALDDEIDGETEDRLFRHYSGTFQDTSDAPPPGSAAEHRDRGRIRMKRWDPARTH